MEEKNSVDQTLFSEKSLYLLNVKELRVLGRNFGVPSPTTKSKKELVDYILNVVYGKIQVPVRNLYGRKPNTKKFDIELYLDKIKKNSGLTDELKNLYVNADLGYAKVSSPSVEYNSGENLETRIYCYENEQHILKAKAFIESDEDIEIAPELVEKFKLVHLDVVDIVISGGLIKVVSINGIKIKDNFSGLAIDNISLNSGESQDFYLCTKEEIEEKINELIKACENRDISLVIFSQNNYTGEKIQTVTYKETEDKSQIYKKLMLFVGLCEKIVNSGEDLIVILENKNWILEIINEFDEDVSARIEKHLHDMFCKITDLGNIYLSFDIE